MMLNLIRSRSCMECCQCTSWIKCGNFWFRGLGTCSKWIPFHLFFYSPKRDMNRACECGKFLAMFCKTFSPPFKIIYILILFEIKYTFNKFYCRHKNSISHSFFLLKYQTENILSFNSYKALDISHIMLYINIYKKISRIHKNMKLSLNYFDHRLPKEHEPEEHPK
jgi:hypothetical protein